MRNNPFADRALAYQRKLEFKLLGYLRRGVTPKGLIEDYADACVECVFYGMVVGRG